MVLHKLLTSKEQNTDGDYQVVIVLEQKTTLGGLSWLVIIDGQMVRYDDYKDVQDIVNHANQNEYYE